jgi:quercetin dioxygenase-like cupin family protein
MSIVDGFEFEAMVGDPDNHRPGSEWALVVDPGGPEGRVEGLAVILEHIAPGDRIPAHVHRVDEVILPGGPGRLRLGDDTRAVEDGAVAFIPAGAVHGLGAFPDNAFALTEIVVGPQGVFEVARLTGTNLGPWAGAPPSGLPMDLEVLILFPWDPVAQRFGGERIWLGRGLPAEG